MPRPLLFGCVGAALASIVVIALFIAVGVTANDRRPATQTVVRYVTVVATPTLAAPPEPTSAPTATPTAAAVPDPTSAPTATPTAAAVPDPTSTPTAKPDATYEIRAGDTLSAIADRFGVGVDELISANGIADPNILLVGAVLVVPGAASAGPSLVPTSSATECPTDDQERYMETLRGTTRYIVSARFANLNELFQLAENNLALLLSAEWKNKVGVELRGLEVFSAGIVAMDRPAGTEDIHFTLVRLQAVLRSLAADVTTWVDDLDVEAGSRVGVRANSVSELVDILYDQMDSFCD